MAECIWKTTVVDENSPLFTGGDLAPETLKALAEEAGKYGVDMDSLGMIEMGMIFEESEKARGEVKLAAGMCACDGSACLVVRVVDNIANNPNQY